MFFNPWLFIRWIFYLGRDGMCSTVTIILDYGENFYVFLNNSNYLPEILFIDYGSCIIMKGLCNALWSISQSARTSRSLWYQKNMSILKMFLRIQKIINCKSGILREWHPNGVPCTIVIFSISSSPLHRINTIDLILYNARFI